MAHPALHSAFSQAAPPQHETAFTQQRIAALDFTKGSLVLIMILYHWFNYFVTSEGIGYRYLRFLTPSFICITGFLISHIYLARNELSSLRIAGRLVTRGAKLLAVFAVLNAAGSLVHPGSLRSVASFSVRQALSTYVLGTTSGDRAVVFGILVPIGYLLLLSAAFVPFARARRALLLGGCVSVTALILALDLAGIRNGNLGLIGIGLIGVALGTLPDEALEKIATRPGELGMVYAAYVVAITIWGELYPFQIVGVCFSLGLLFWLGSRTRPTSRAYQIVLLLGRYSLFGYIAQIAILQLLHKVLVRGDFRVGIAALAVLAAVVLTIGSVEAVDYMRKRMHPVDRLYKAVFA